MAHVGTKLEIRPEIIDKLRTGKEKLWAAAYEDGSDSRINEQAVIDSTDFGVEVTALTVMYQWAKKLFRNKGKTREELAKEKEAARINRTCGALEEMLLEYLRAAREGSVDEETLDELIDTLAEMQEYYQSGKLMLSGGNDLADIMHSIAAFTSAIAEKNGVQAGREAEGKEAGEFALLRGQLVRQKELLSRLP